MEQRPSPSRCSPPYHPQGAPAAEARSVSGLHQGDSPVGSGQRDRARETATEAAGNGSLPRRRPLRILFVTARYLPERGGTEIHTREVAKRLAERGAEVTVASIAPSGPFEPDSREGAVRVLRVRAWPHGRDYYLAPALAHVIRESR